MFILKVPFYRFVAFMLKIAGYLIPQPMPMLFCGAKSSEQLARHIARSEATKVFVVTDKIIHQLGLCDAFCEILRNADLDVVIFDEVQPDPDDILIRAGILKLKQFEGDCVVGLGGGSALDAAKLIAVMANANQDLSKIAGILKIKKAGLPFYLLPTTSGTGSEVTMAAVMTNATNGQKDAVVDPKLLPAAIALDPTLMLGMPKSVTAITGMDALTHGIEAYISRNRSTTTDRYARMCVQLVFSYLRTAYLEGENEAAREGMALASCYGGLAFTKAGLGYVHGIAHQLGAIYHIPHGLANSYVLPHVLDYSEPAVRDRFCELAEAIGIERRGKTALEYSQAFIAAVYRLRGDIDLPDTCAELQRKDIPKIVKDALNESHYLHPVPRFMSPAQCHALVEKVLVQ